MANTSFNAHAGLTPVDLIEIVNDEPRVSSLVIAEKMGLQHKNLLKNINKYASDLETLGRVAFETQPFETNGGTQQRKVAL